MLTVEILVPTIKSAEDVSPVICDLEGFCWPDRVIVHSSKGSAAHNRNCCLNRSAADIVVMCDDDLCGFYPKWHNALVDALLADDTLLMVSARLIKTDWSPALMMGADQGVPGTTGITIVPKLPTACVAFRNEDLRFDEAFVGSGFEDDDFLMQLRRRHPGGRFAIVEGCRVVHINEMKNQTGEFWDKNKATFEQKWGIHA
jgi:hypothetical protein